ncbi:hypothetical protein Tco_0926689 [Tanacetum coccineum]|uniref:Uncharacterized protein n=1 Tax=Tanacetum coccineum TaxID=301880 RepID=A0ABQ5DAJ7_9ASTR
MCDKKNKVLFTDTEYLVLSPDFKLPDENQVLLRVPRQHNMYSFNLENFVPFEGLTCLIAKATTDESNKWHRRLGHEPEEQVDQVFLEELKRLKRQEKDANDAAEALRMNFAEPRVSTDAPHPDQDDSQIPTLEDMYDSPSSRIFTKASYDDEGAVADFINLESIVNVSPIPTSRIHHYPTTSNIPPLLGDPT